MSQVFMVKMAPPVERGKEGENNVLNRAAAPELRQAN